MPVELGLPAGNDQGGHLDEGKGRPHIDLGEPVKGGLGQAFWHCQAQVSNPPLAKAQVVGDAGGGELKHVTGGAVLFNILAGESFGHLGRGSDLVALIAG